MSEFAIGTRVRLSAAGIARLGPTRARDPRIGGTIKGYEEKRPGQRRVQVRWDRPDYIEALPAQFVEAIAK